MALLAALYSCKGQEAEVYKVAEQFLESFFKIDYESAEALCTEEFKEEISFLSKSLEGLDQGVKEKVIELSKGVNRELLGVDKSSSKDTLFLNYKMVLPSNSSSASNRLTMVKSELGWRVGGFSH